MKYYTLHQSPAVFFLIAKLLQFTITSAEIKITIHLFKSQNDAAGHIYKMKNVTFGRC